MAHQVKNSRLPTEQSRKLLPLCLLPGIVQLKHNVVYVALKTLGGGISTLEPCLLEGGRKPLVNCLYYFCWTINYIADKKFFLATRFGNIICHLPVD